MNFLPATARRHEGVGQGRASQLHAQAAGRGLRAGGRRALLRRRAPRGRPRRRRRTPKIDANVFVTEPLGGETVVDLHLGDRVVKALAPPTAKFSAGRGRADHARPAAPACVRRRWRGARLRGRREAVRARRVEGLNSGEAARGASAAAARQTFGCQGETHRKAVPGSCRASVAPHPSRFAGPSACTTSRARRVCTPRRPRGRSRARPTARSTRRRASA